MGIFGESKSRKIDWSRRPAVFRPSEPLTTELYVNPQRTSSAEQVLSSINQILSVLPPDEPSRQVWESEATRLRQELPEITAQEETADAQRLFTKDVGEIALSETPVDLPLAEQQRQQDRADVELSVIDTAESSPPVPDRRGGRDERPAIDPSREDIDTLNINDDQRW